MDGVSCRHAHCKGAAANCVPARLHVPTLQFGPGAIQQHGFARNLDWEISNTSADPNPDEKDPSLELVLTDNEYTTKMWPYKFKVVYTITLHGEQLQTQFRVINNDTKPFDFSAALHTYIEVLSIDKAKVTGLKGEQGHAGCWGHGVHRMDWGHEVQLKMHARARGCTCDGSMAPEQCMHAVL